MASVPLTVEALIEIPMGSRMKYEYDEVRHRLRLDRVLFTSVVYPANYGFILDTLAPDGDPLDILVIVQEPVIPGCIVRARVLGLLHMLDAGKDDAKVLAVEHTDPHLSHLRALHDVSPNMLKEFELFMSTYKKLDGGQIEVGVWGDLDAATAWIEQCRRGFDAHAAQRSAGTSR